jgi:hypothetical protein
MTTKQVAIAELEGAALDWAVAMAVCPESFRGSRRHDGTPNWVAGWLDNGSPSTHWRKCGPLIERFEVEIAFIDGFGWTANVRFGKEYSCYDSPTIAVCRAIVAAHNPDGFVEVPEDLL